MKLHLLSILLLLTYVKSTGQVNTDYCAPNGIYTDPEHPAVNPQLEGYFLHFRNSFKWYEKEENVPGDPNQGYHLRDFPLASNMDDFHSGPFNMNHPFYEQNSYNWLFPSPYNFQELDMYPEQGWEMVALNLGYYPNGEILDITQTHSNMPYVILYNKYRSVLRVFVNYNDDTYSSWDIARVTISFGEDPENVSGLLRLNAGKDQALDQETIIQSVTVPTRYESNDHLWFYADFNVAFDPCTCNYPSSLNLVVQLVNVFSLQMVEHSIAVPFDLLDSNGNLNINQSFLAGISNSGVLNGDGITEYAGSAIYKQMEGLINQYRIQLREALLFNASINASNEEIERKLTFLNTMKTILEFTETFGEFIILPETAIAAAAATATTEEVASGTIENTTIEIEEATEHFINTVHSISTDEPEIATEESDGIHIDFEALVRKLPSIIGKGLDLYIEHIKEGEEETKPLPKMPTGMMSESTFVANIEDVSTNTSVTIRTPGATSVVDENSSVDYFSYPTYNEILGMFALLETPKFQVYKNNDIVSIYNSKNYADEVTDDTDFRETTFEIGCMCNEYWCEGTDGNSVGNAFTYGITTIQNSIDYQFKLVNPLVFALNPNSSIDLTNANLEAAIIANVTLPVKQSFMAYENDIWEIEDSDHRVNFSPLSSQFQKSAVNQNFTSNDGLITNASNVNQTIRFESPFVPINALQDFICGSSILNTEKWKDENYHQIWEQGDSEWAYHKICQYSYPQTQSIEDFLTARVDLQSEQLPLPVLQLKLKVTLPIANTDFTTTFLLTYDIPANGAYMIPSDSEFPVSFSFTDNPNGNGSLQLSEYLMFPEKSWTSGDYDLYGGVNGTTIIPTAINQINITGNQSLSTPTAEVIFTAGNNIVVSGDVILPLGFSLVLDDIVNVPAPTPVVPASPEFLAGYCAGLVPNTYHANVPRHGVLSINDFTNTNYPNNLDIIKKMSVYPNPTSAILNISLQNFDGAVQFDIFNAIGNRLQGFSKTVDGSHSKNLVTFSADELPNGTYTISATMADGTSLTKLFVVLK